MYGRCVFLPLWNRAREALEEVYDGTTFHELVIQDAKARENRALDFSI